MSKSLITFLLLATLAAGCAATGVPGSAGIDMASSREVVLTVHGLSCPLCSNNLDGQLRRIEGVDGAAIDLKTGAVTVRLGEAHSVSAEDLALAVEAAGFTLKKIEPAGAE